jgi:hypothetical protein
VKPLALVAVVLLMLSLGLVVAPAGAEEQTALAYVQARYKDKPEPGADARYSRRIERLWGQCEEREAETGEPCMDSNLWVDAQDWEIKDQTFEQTVDEAERAQIVSTFDNMGRATKITIDLVKDDEGWAIDDIGTGCDTLSGVLRAEGSIC